jgi:hypothetical protein
MSNAFVIRAGATILSRTHDAGLNHGPRKHRCNRFRKALEPVGRGDQGVIDGARLEVIDDLEPEPGTLGLLDP